MEKSKTFTVDVRVKSSLEKVWDTAFKQFGDTYIFNPNIIASRLIKGDVGNVGSERKCDLDSKTYVKERITEAKEKESFTVDIYDGNMPMVDKMVVTFNFSKISELETKISLQAEFNTRPRLAAVMLLSPMKKKLSDLLIGLKYYLETGKRIDSGNFKPVRKEYHRLVSDNALAFSS